MHKKNYIPTIVTPLNFPRDVPWFRFLLSSAVCANPNCETAMAIFLFMALYSASRLIIFRSSANARLVCWYNSSASWLFTIDRSRMFLGSLRRWPCWMPSLLPAVCLAPAAVPTFTVSLP